MDGLNHLQAGDRTYNGFRLADIVEDHGTNRLGIDTLPQVVTRGLLLDVAAARGGERLLPGEVITIADAEAALAVAGQEIRPGTRCSSTPAGAPCGAPATNGTPPASQVPVWRWPRGSLITGWRWPMPHATASANSCSSFPTPNCPGHRRLGGAAGDRVKGAS